MGEGISEKCGGYLVRLARWQIGKKLGIEAQAPKAPRCKGLGENRGAFVTLHVFKPRGLRGCIGYIEPIMALEKAVAQCALHAAFEDGRFEPLAKSELGNVIVEVSVLSQPQIIGVKSPREYLEKIKIGKDGLVLEAGYCRGVFLPQVPIEQGWGVEEYLEELCVKAGAGRGCWMAQNAKVYKFQTFIFAEEKPNGRIVVG